MNTSDDQRANAHDGRAATCLGEISANRPRIAWRTVVVVVVALSAAIAATRSMDIGHDAMPYFLVAEQIRCGHGVRIPVFGLWDAPDEVGTVPLTVQPPMYPSLLAAFECFGSDLFAARVLNVLCHLVIVYVVYAMGVQIGGRAIGMAAGLASAVHNSLLGISHAVMSESVFIAFSLLALLLLLRSRRSRHHLLCLFAGGMAVAFAVATRFAGAALIPVVAWAGCKGGKSRWKESILGILIGCAAPLAAIGLVWARNVVLVGNIRGYTQPQVQVVRSMAAALFGVLKSTAHVLGMTNLTLLLIGGIVGCLLFAGAAVALRRRTSRVVARHSGLDIIIVFLVAYAIVLAYSMSRYEFNFENRFFVPLVPGLLLLTAWSIGVAWSSARARVRDIGMFVSLGVLVIGVAAFSTRNVRPQWERQESPVRATSTFQWVAANARPQEILVTNVAFEISYFLKRPTLWLPHRSWDRNNVLPPAVDDLLLPKMVSLGARYLVLSCERQGLGEEHWGGFIAGLSRRQNSGEKFKVAFECSDGVVYRLGK